MSKFTEEQQAAVDSYKAEILRLASGQGVRTEATKILAKADKAFREPHAADAAAEQYAHSVAHQYGYDMAQLSIEDGREALREAFRAGYDARGNVTEAPADVPVQPESDDTAEPVKAGLWPFNR